MPVFVLPPVYLLLGWLVRCGALAGATCPPSIYAFETNPSTVVRPPFEFENHI